MADPTTSGITQAQITALLQQLGLGPQAAQALGGTNATTGSPADAIFAQKGGAPTGTFDPTAGTLGGTPQWSDAQLMAGINNETPLNSAGRPTSQTWSGGGNGQVPQGQNPMWFPKTANQLDLYSQAQKALQSSHAGDIANLLNGLGTQSPAAPPINLATQLNNQSGPNVAPVINGSSGGFIDPTKSFLPGMGPAAAPAAGSLPSLSTPASAPNALAATQQMINTQNTLPTAPVSMQAPVTMIHPSNLAAQVQAGTAPQSAIIGAGGPLQASAESGISPGSLPPPSSIPSQPMMRSYAPPAPLKTTIMPSGSAGQSGYAATPAPVPGGVAAAGGQGYLPASAGAAGAISGPTVVPGAGGYTTDPNAASANQPTDSAAASGAAMNPQIAGTLASGIGKIGAALAPRTITNDAQTKINPNLLPPPVKFGAPVLTGR